MVALGSAKERCDDQMTKPERRELTAAEIDLVDGGNTLQDFMISGYNLMDATNKEAAYFTLSSGSARTGNNSASAMYDIRQNRAA
jgi:hypothetical protein